MLTRGRTNKSPIKLNMQRKINWHNDLFTNGENQHSKNPHRVILRSPPPRIHYYHNKRLQVKESQYLIPTYSWTLNPIPTWTCSVVTISPFNARLPSTWLTTNLRRMLAAKFFSSSTQWRSRNSLVTKPYGVQMQ